MNKRKVNSNGTLEEDLRYLKQIGRKYDVDLGNKVPIVSVKRLKFNASSFGGSESKVDEDFLSKSAAMYNMLGKIFNVLEVKDRYSASACCRLWNRAAKESTAWKNIIMKNKFITDLSTLQRKVLKYETEYIYLEKVFGGSSSFVQDFCRFNTIVTFVCYQTETSLIKKILKACNQLKYFKSDTADDSILEDLNPYINVLEIENIAINHENTKIIKNFTDLETLRIKTIEPYCYKSISLFFSIKNLTLATLLINNDIQNVVECIPNIECLEFTPVMEEYDSNSLVVEALKRCPSLKKLHWVMESQPKHLKIDTTDNNSVNAVSDLTVEDKNGITHNDNESICSLKKIALKKYLSFELQECEVIVSY